MNLFYMIKLLATVPSVKVFLRFIVMIPALVLCTQTKSQAPLADTVSISTDTANTKLSKEFAARAIAKLLNDTSTWQYKMEHSGEHWGRMAKKEDYQLFIKTNFQSSEENKSRANIGFYGIGTLIWLNGAMDVEIAAAGVTAENANDFIYHVVVNDSTELVPWTKPTTFKTNKNITYAYLGKFDMRNKFLKLEFYNTKNYQEKSVWNINGLYMPAAVVKMVMLEDKNKFLSSPYKQHYLHYDQNHYYLPAKNNAQPFSFEWSQNISDLRVVMNNTLQNDMYHVYIKKTTGQGTDTTLVSNKWAISYYSRDPELFISASYFNQPGKYEIIVVPEAPAEFKINSLAKAVVIPFTVLPSKTRWFSGTQLLLTIAFVVLFAALLFSIYYFINRRRSAKATRQQEIATLQLQSVRSQLNPHFMFNALAGIQSLINKGDVNATNLYLSKFSRITRNVLEDRNKETITIEEELSLLEDYLQMEQMRFGFKYNIAVDKKIDRANTEIPSMLLQPYIENSVKHGVSALKQDGVISINFFMLEKKLIMEVKDNGNGYDTNTARHGDGTILSEKRVDLINQVKRKNSITVIKQSGPTGTNISIQLNDLI